MKGVTFYSPATLQEAANFLNTYKEACIIAGGTDLVPLYNLREKKPSDKLVFLGKVNELKGVRLENEALVIGAMTTYSELENNQLVKQYAPCLASAAYKMGNPQIRNQGTIGGNLGFASPAADGAVALLAEDALVTIISANGERKVNLEEFFVDKNKVALEPGEFIGFIRVPVASGTSKKGIHMRSQERRGSSLALVSVAVSADFKGEQCVKVRISAGAVAPKPLRCRKAEEAWDITPQNLEKVAAALAEEISPIDDSRATAWYRREVAQVLVKRAIEQVLNQN